MVINDPFLGIPSILSLLLLLEEENGQREDTSSFLSSQSQCPPET